MKIACSCMVMVLLLAGCATTSEVDQMIGTEVKQINMKFDAQTVTAAQTLEEMKAFVSRISIALNNNVNALQKTVDGLEKQIAVVKKEIGSTKSDVKGVSSEVAKLESSIAALSSSLAALKTDVAEKTASSAADAK